MRTIFFVVSLLFNLGWSHQAEWTYEDESHWPGDCTTGQRQSPINIIPNEALVDRRGLFIHSPLKYEGYENVDIRAINNGHTIQFGVVPGAPTPVLSGGPLDGKYKLLQFHLHWPSEHSFNGRKFTAEVHMVHMKEGYTLDQAVKKEDGLAVIGIWCEITAEPNNNFALEEITPLLPSLRNKTEGEPGTATILDVRRIFSPDHNGYYTYQGSLTTPRCSEAVTWMVFDLPISMSEEQFKLLSQINVGGIANFRSIQPTRTPVYHTVSSCSALLPGSFSILVSIFQCSSNILGVANKHWCKFTNIKRRIAGLMPVKC